MASKPKSYQSLAKYLLLLSLFNSTETLNLRKSIFLFLNRELFDLRKIYVVNLKTGRPKKLPYVGEFAT